MTKAISEALKVFEELQKQVADAEQMVKTRIQESYHAGLNVIVWDTEKIGGWVKKGIVRVDNFFVHFLDGTKAHFTALIHPDHLSEVTSLGMPTPPTTIEESVTIPESMSDPVPMTVPVPSPENSEKPTIHVPDPIPVEISAPVTEISPVPETTPAPEQEISVQETKKTMVINFDFNTATRLLSLFGLPADVPGVIFFTTNGSDPATPANPAVQVYGGPLALAPGSIVRALVADPAGNLNPSTTESFSVPTV